MVNKKIISEKLQKIKNFKSENHKEFSDMLYSAMDKNKELLNKTDISVYYREILYSFLYDCKDIIGIELNQEEILNISFSFENFINEEFN